MIFTTVSQLQKHLKSTISTSNIEQLVKTTIKEYIHSNVYQAYVPSGENAYDRTYDLINAVDLFEIKTGTKHHTFEVYVNPDLIHAQVMEGTEWNKHASMPNSQAYDVSEYIPLWIEEGTEGSLWDRNGAYFAEEANWDLGRGRLVKELAGVLRNAGYRVHLD